jgi:hypothetical protein
MSNPRRTNRRILFVNRGFNAAVIWIVTLLS